MMGKFGLYIILIILALIFQSCGEKTIDENTKSISVSEVLGSESDSGFKKAVEKIRFRFPDDNGAHPEFRTEWWYFTGNLETKTGRKFGYQFTIFRTALSPEKTEKNSVWNSNQVYMGHFTVTDIENNDFYYSEKFSREGNDLAGANATPLKIWVEDWRVNEVTELPEKEFPEVKISAETDETEIELFLTPVKNIILQGDEGLSKKSNEEGNASYYYSITRIETKGKMKIKGEEFEVIGYSWLDREWSTSALSHEQKGWDWFSLQLDNDYEVMYYQMRKKNGSADDFSKGAIVNPQGVIENISLQDVILEVTEYWINDEGMRYPSGWKLLIPSKQIEFVITPATKNQELKLSVRYWEGSVFASGKFGTENATGRGYVELTGYEHTSQ